MSYLDDAMDFRRAMGQPIGDPTVEGIEMQFRLIREEHEELVASCDEDETLKEMADLVYVVYQLAAAMDWDLDEAIRRVHASNMSKLVDGKPLYREDGKVLKGPNYRVPEMKDLVTRTK